MTQTVPVSTYALWRRVNRRLKLKHQKLDTARGHAVHDLGRYYIVNLDKNELVDSDVDLTKLATKLNCLQPYERVED